jgi:nitrous oxidase accessory protein
VSRRRIAILGAAAALVVCALGARAQGRSDDLQGPPPPVDDAGPTDLRAPSGAFIVSDSSGLTAALADPEAPRDIWLRPGTYRGDFVVARTLALHGEQGVTLEGTGSGTVLTVTADDAWIDNMTVRHSGRRHTVEDAGIKAKASRVRVSHVAVDDALFGVIFAPCPGCVLDHARIRGTSDDEELRGDGIKLWESSDAIVRGCVVEESRDVVVWYSRRVLLDQNVVRHGRYGTHFMYAHDSIVRGSRIESNVVGIFVMYSNHMHVEGNVLAGARGPAGVGIGFKESDGVDVRDNWIVANTTGVYIDRTPRSIDSPVVFERNVLALNDVGLRLHSSEEGLSFVSNDFHQNVKVAEVEGGGDAMAVRFEGNHWTEYEGYDLDHDGFGDVAFEVKQLSGELTDAHPALQFFDGTGAMSVIDAVARAVPVLAAHRVLVDRHPVMTAPRPRAGGAS